MHGANAIVAYRLRRIYSKNKTGNMDDAGKIATFLAILYNSYYYPSTLHTLYVIVGFTMVFVNASFYVRYRF